MDLLGHVEGGPLPGFDRTLGICEGEIDRSIVKNNAMCNTFCLNHHDKIEVGSGDTLPTPGYLSRVLFELSNMSYLAHAICFLNKTHSVPYELFYLLFILENV
jgi:hypothetical protein